MLTIHVIPKGPDSPPCVQCDATVRTANKEGLIEGEDYKVVELTDQDRADLKERGGKLQAPYCSSDLLGEEWFGYHPGSIRAHADLVHKIRDQKQREATLAKSA